MKKQKKQFLILLIILIVMIAAYLGAGAYADALEKQEAEKELASKIYITELDAADIQSVTYDYKGETYSFAKEEDVWVSAEDSSLAIIQSKIEKMAEAAAQLEAQNMIEEVTDLEQYGLAEPSKTIQFTAGDAEYELWLGDYNTNAAAYYICNAADTGVVYTVKSTDITCFNYALESLIEE